MATPEWPKRDVELYRYQLPILSPTVALPVTPAMAGSCWERCRSQLLP